MNTNAWITSMLSLISSVITSIILHPLDVVKTRQQVSATSDGAVVVFPSLFKSIKYIIKTEGFSGLYKGLNGQVVASSISWFIFRYIFDFTRYNLENIYNQELNTFSSDNRNHKTFQISIKSNTIATLIAGYISTILVHPLWLVKTRLEIQSIETRKKGWKQYSSGLKGFIECFGSIYKKGGISNLYSGFIPTLLLVPQSAIQFVIYDILRNRCQINNIISSGTCFFSTAFLSRLFASLLTYPLQVLRSRIQVYKLENTSPKLIRSSSLKFKRETFIHFIKNHMYPGIMAHIPKVCFHNAIMLLIYEIMLKMVLSL